jgi:hypothetical protein
LWQFFECERLNAIFQNSSESFDLIGDIRKEFSLVWRERENVLYCYCDECCRLSEEQNFLRNTGHEYDELHFGFFKKNS